MNDLVKEVLKAEKAMNQALKRKESQTKAVRKKRVLYEIVWMIKIKGSTVSLQDKTMYFTQPAFF